MNCTHFVCITNYVGQVLYKGNPVADAGSEEYKNYIESMQIASLGMQMFYCFYVVFSLFHSKVLNKVGLRVKYLGASVSCCVFMLSLVLSESVIVFFANTVTMAVFRSAVYTISFILSDKHVQQKFKESTDNSKDRSSSSQSGFAMASVTAMIPASNFVVNLVMGPLINVTGYPGALIIFALVSCALRVMSMFFVQFE